MIGLVLQDIQFDDKYKATYVFYGWRPGKGSPALQQNGSETRNLSLDRKFGFTIASDTVEIHDANGSRRVAFTRADDREAVAMLGETEFRWVGGHGLVVDLDELMVLDLATGKLRYLLPSTGLTFESASLDGTVVLARNDNGRFVWSHVQ